MILSRALSEHILVNASLLISLYNIPNISILENSYFMYVFFSFKKITNNYERDEIYKKNRNGKIWESENGWYIL